MSEEDLQAVTARFHADAKFAGELLRNFEQAVRENGYSLDEDELLKAEGAFNAPTSSTEAAPMAGTQPSATQPFQPFAGNQLLQLREAQLRRMIDLGEYTVRLLKGTLNNAKLTYQLITVMNGIMFCMGVGLFLFAAVYGAVSRNLPFTVAFAGLGAASFVALFLLGPIDKAQDALSNLIQAEVAFMNYFEQMCFLEGCAQVPSPGSNVASVENLERASALLQKRTQETIELLQIYLENCPARDSSRGSPHG
jgi:ABC-type multidrug transport system fused ATPase/permease subunit